MLTTVLSASLLERHKLGAGVEFEFYQYRMSSVRDAQCSPFSRVGHKYTKHEGIDLMAVDKWLSEVGNAAPSAIVGAAAICSRSVLQLQ